MRPLATIKLDAPDATGEIRGVIFWRRDRGAIYVLDPRTDQPDRDPEAPILHTLDAAIDYAERAWGSDPETWDYEPLCSEGADYYSPPG